MSSWPDVYDDVLAEGEEHGRQSTMLAHRYLGTWINFLNHNFLRVSISANIHQDNNVGHPPDD
jgi:hypothetical protein